MSISFSCYANIIIDFTLLMEIFLENKITPETSLGFLIAGYSKGEGHPEMFLININDGKIEEPEELNADDPLSISWFGETLFLTRLLLGFDERLLEIFEDN